MLPEVTVRLQQAVEIVHLDPSLLQEAVGVVIKLLTVVLAVLVAVAAGLAARLAVQAQRAKVTMAPAAAEHTMQVAVGVKARHLPAQKVV